MTVDFNDYFWGDKNSGYEVLYQNMKYGLAACKELSEFFRERSNLEEYNSKLLTKLAHKAGSGGNNGTFSPLWIILKTSVERLSEIHLQMVQKITELVKCISKYADELHKKHKSVKEEESSTQDAVQAMKDSTLAVQKSKDLYTSKLQEVEKLKKDNGSAKDIEKAEAKLKKHQDEYKVLVEKHNPIKLEFEKKMTATCKRFQDIEEAHLKQMKDFLTTYIEIVQNNHDMVNQVNSDFKRQFLELTVDKLLEQFVLNKYTGLEKPELIELDLVNLTNNELLNTTASSGSINDNPIQQQQSQIPTFESPNLSTSSGFNIIKKESNLRSWFSSSSTTSVQQMPQQIIDGSSINADDQLSPSTSSMNSGSGNITPTPSSSVQSMKTSKTTNYGDYLYSRKFNINKTNNSNINNNNNSSPSHKQPHHQQMKTPESSSSTTSTSTKQEHQQSQQQSKSSRRTTSLLNLFMSNSQGNRESRENRENSSSNDVLSAPTSPIGQLDNQSSSNIGRNPLLRGSKFSGFLRSRREKAKSKKDKKKKNADSLSNKDDKASDNEEKDDVNKSENSNVVNVASSTSNTAKSKSASKTNLAPTATPEVDEEGYSVQPKDTNSYSGSNTNIEKSGKEAFYSSSDSDTEDERESLRKIHVEIKPLNNGTAPISASVDELRATVENLSLSPIGVLSGRRGSNSESDTLNMKRSQSVSQQIGNKPSNDLLGLNIFQQQQQQQQNNQQTNTNQQQHTSPIASNASTPTTTTHPYAPLQSPTLSNSRYADLGDIFSEVGDISVSAPPSANLSKINRQIPTPTSGNSIAIPRPPSRRSAETTGRGRVSPASIARADSVSSLEFRTAGVGFGSSRGPSPLTIGMSDTLPLAVAFHEIIHAYFKGSDESKCQVKMSGDMMLSFPAGIVNIFANNPNPAKLGFVIKNIQNLENILPNKHLLTVDKLQSTTSSTMLQFNMPALTALLRQQSEQNPTALYFNVDVIKYHIKSKPGAQSCPFQLVSYWKCEQTHTDIKIDYKYNNHAMAQPSPLLNVSLTLPVDGGVRNVQSKPHSAWLGESNRLVWNFTDISQHSENSGIDTLRARLEVGNGPSTPSMLSTQFNCEGTTLSGIEFELAGTGYRLSLVKRRFVSGKYICEGDGIRGSKTPTNIGSPNSFSKSD